MTNGLRQQRDMGDLIRGLKVTTCMTGTIMTGSVIIELAEKYNGKFGERKIATGEVKAVDTATEN